MEDTIQAPVDDISPPVFDISSRNRFAPLCETEYDAVIIGDSIDVSVQIPAILKDDESVAAVAAVSRWGYQHQAAADGNTEEELQEPDRDGTQHIAQNDNHHARTSSHVSTRTRKVQ